MKVITKRILSGTMALCMTTGVCLAADTTAADNTTDETQTPTAVTMPESGVITQIRYDQLKPTMNAYSPTMMALDETESALEVFDRERARDSLLDAYNALTSLSFALGDYSMNMMISSQQTSMKTQLDALKEDEYAKTYEDSILQIRASQNQLLMGAQSLYIQIASLEDQLDTVNKQLASLQRTLTTTKKAYEIGAFYSLTLESLQTQIATAESGANTLKYNIKICKQNLQMLMGSKTTGELVIGDVPEVAQETLSAIQYDTDMETAIQKNATVVSAKHDMENLKEDLEDAEYGGYKLKQLQHQYQASIETYNANLSSFKSSFQTAYQSLAEKERLIQTEENELAMEKRNLEVSELKYKLGAISYNTYLNQKDTYDIAAADVSAAKLALYQAYNTYYWATQGVVSTQG